MIREKNFLQNIGRRDKKLKVLVLAPHNDDEILGVGGTILKYIRNSHEVYVCEMTSGPMYKILQEEARKAHNFLGIKKTFFLNLPVGKLKILEPYEINAKINEVVEEVRPDIVYLPFVGDMHIDHKETADSAMVALRPINQKLVREIYMYETLSETGWNVPIEGRNYVPNTWVDISEYLQDKLTAMRYYESQLLDYPHPRSIEAIKALAMYRGTTIGVHFAESFMLVRKIEI